jgi:hypothetical protein
MFGRRNQLGRIMALAGAFADDGGRGVLVAVVGRGHDRQPEPMTAGPQSRR